MKTIFVTAMLLIGTAAAAAQQKPATLRSTLLDELHSVHDRTGWFVSADTAVASLTPQQAAWSDGKGNHSVGQLTYHLAYWDQNSLAILRGEHPQAVSNNDLTFTGFDAKQWPALVHQLDQVMTDLEGMVQKASDAQLAEWAPRIANVSMHNAYHIGEIVMVRKEQGVWDASKGVK